MAEIEEEEEDETTALSLYRRVLTANYYETVDPVDYTAEEQPLTKVPQSFKNIQVRSS